ncbi:MAG: NADP-dependent oxidoreductase [Thermomicrobiales bacterium]
MSSDTMMNRQVILVERPDGPIVDATFAIREAPLPALAEGEALVRVAWLGIDATQRTWLNDDETYIEPVPIGAVMRGSGVGQVVASRSERLPLGAWMYGTPGWQEYVVVREERANLLGLHPVPPVPGLDPKAMLSVYGVNGLTAYFGLVDIGGLPEDAAGKTVLVTGAAGGVGSIAGQIARACGARVIGVAGGPAKTAWIREVARLAEAIDYRAEDESSRLAELAPDGIDIVFDNVGGGMLEAALDHLAPHARVVLCGGIASGYRRGQYGETPRNLMNIAFRRARMEGYIFLDYVERFPEALGRLLGWVQAGEIVWHEQVAFGLVAAPAALQGLFEGRNLGKQLVRVWNPDA